MKNEKTVERIIKEFSENINSHVFLFETNDINAAVKDVKTIINSALKADEITQEQVENESYIELNVLRSDGKDIKKDQVLDLQTRLRVKPVLSDYLFYIIEEAELMNEIAANKLLKTIEEPNESVVGFLITKNTDLILPTIKSRCEIEKLHYEQNIASLEENEELDAIIKVLIEAIEKRNFSTYIEYKNKDNKNYIKENCKNIAKLLKDYYNSACLVNTNEALHSDIVSTIMNNSNYKTILKKAEYLNLLDNKVILNMNGELLLDKIVLELKDVK